MRIIFKLRKNIVKINERLMDTLLKSVAVPIIENIKDKNLETEKIVEIIRGIPY
ncbi:hypothetical protein [Clostridium amazonitimonense]|uniref:hypothetical protein n=1 Tax=Clostridium amazonitimonense TaxID=1499689 RepID=UPI000B2697F2|nr:hypothetical protein [Clostridium amazonitimonense]